MTGIVLASYGLMQFLFRLPIGIVSDLLGKRKRFIVLGMAISTTSCLVFALTESVGWVLFSRSLAGVAAAFWVVFTILFSSYVTEDKLHRAMGSLSFAVVFAQLLGMAMSAWIVEEWGDHAPYWIGAVLGGLGLLLSFFIEESKGQENRKPLNVREMVVVLKEPALLKASSLSILAHGIMFTTIFGFTTAYVLSVGFKPGDVTLLVFAFMIPHALSTILSGKTFVPLFGAWRTLQGAFLVAAMFTCLIPFVESLGVMLLLQIMNGFALGLLFPLFLGMAVEKIEHEKRATAMGAYQALYAVGMFTGPFLAGLLNSIFGLEASFFFSGFMGGAAFLLCLLWEKQE